VFIGFLADNKVV